MDLLQILALALLQGLTEFLPISSSAHLILLPILLGWEDQGLVFDVAVHLGTLAAVVAYFRFELIAITRAWGRDVFGGHKTAESRLGWAVLIGTIPAGLAGLLLAGMVELYLRSPMVIALATIGFGGLLWWSDARGRRNRDEYSLTWKDILVIGGAQALALIPGTSRSGITMTAGLALGLDRRSTARFSFLLSIPVILLAGGLKVGELSAEVGPVDWTALALGVLISAISAYLCIGFFLKLIDRIGMFPFVIYRFLLGVVLIGIFWN